MIKQFSTSTFLSSLMLSTSLCVINCYGTEGNPEEEEGRNNLKRSYQIQKFKLDSNVIDLATLNATQGFTIQGATQSDYSGWSVSYAGDMNGDGLNDVIVGAGVRDNNSAGVSYVIYGQKGGYQEPINLAYLNPKQGFVIQGAEEYDYSGSSVSYAGDMNADGLNDVIVGAPGVNNSAGVSYVIYGQKGEYQEPINLAYLNPKQGFAIQGVAQGDASGGAVNFAGDMNGDGLNDVIVGAIGVNNSAGASYVIYGRKGGYQEPINLAHLNPKQGFVIQGATQRDYSSVSINYAGDMNGDGLNDVIVGAYHYNGYATGASYVIYGRKGGYQKPINLAHLNPKQGFVIQSAPSDFTGISVSYAGDMNGDGLNDVIIGNPFVNNTAGTSYVIYGRKGGYQKPINLAHLNPKQGFVIEGAIKGDYSGWSVNFAGDMNADGLNDVIVGAPGVNNSAGASYVIYGRKGKDVGSISLAHINATQGLIIQGATKLDYSGFSVNFAGDMNGDGLNDIMIGAPWANSSAGTSYVIYGNTSFSDFEPFPSTVNQKIKNQTYKTKNASQKNFSSKNIIKTEKNTGVHIVDDQENSSVLSKNTKISSSENSLPDATSDGLSSHQIPWYSPARWVKALQSLWQQPETEEFFLTSESQALLKMKAESERLISQADDNPDKWYRFSLEDFSEDLGKALKQPAKIDVDTIKHFEERLKGVHRDFRPKASTSQPFVLNAVNGQKTFGVAPAFEMLSISTTPLLGSGYVPLALGK
ncbi:MAG TPA: hypothetical protein VMW10_04065 [Alphaproteobacteria bacterium]|nr:hypothetical protein [Alphaproteobacteria bacterium]